MSILCNTQSYRPTEHKATTTKMRRKKSNKNDDDDDDPAQKWEKMNCNHILRKFYVCCQIHIILHHLLHLFLLLLLPLLYTHFIEILANKSCTVTKLHAAVCLCVFIFIGEKCEEQQQQQQQKIMVIDGVADYLYYYFYYYNEIARH